MSIYGIGVDQVDLKRVKRLLEKSEERFLKRCFTEQEIKYAKRFSDPSKRLGATAVVDSNIISGLITDGDLRRMLEKGVDIIIATPGRLLDHVNTKGIDLVKTTSIVLDEADQMLDLGFFPAIKRVYKYLPEKKQSVFISATMLKPVRALANEFLINPKNLGIENGDKNNLKGKNAEFNAKKIIEICEGKINEFSQSVALNVAAGLVVSGKEEEFKSAFEKAKKHLETGNAFYHLTKIQSYK